MAKIVMAKTMAINCFKKKNCFKSIVINKLFFHCFFIHKLLFSLTDIFDFIYIIAVGQIFMKTFFLIELIHKLLEYTYNGEFNGEYNGRQCGWIAGIVGRSILC